MDTNSHYTPNVTITNPKARRIVRTTLDVIGAGLFIAMAVDAATPALDISPIAVPALAGWTAARTIFGFSVDNPNTPRS